MFEATAKEAPSATMDMAPQSGGSFKLLALCDILSLFMGETPGSFADLSFSLMHFALMRPELKYHAAHSSRFCPKAAAQFMQR